MGFFIAGIAQISHTHTRAHTHTHTHTHTGWVSGSGSLPCLLWYPLWSGVRSSLPPLIKKKKRDSQVFEKVAAFVGVSDSPSVNGGCCVLFRLYMNRRFVCQMTFRQWQQDGWEEGGTEEEECGRGGGGGSALSAAIIWATSEAFVERWRRGGQRVETEWPLLTLRHKITQGARGW